MFPAYDVFSSAAQPDRKQEYFSDLPVNQVTFILLAAINSWFSLVEVDLFGISEIAVSQYTVPSLSEDNN